MPKTSYVKYVWIATAILLLMLSVSCDGASPGTRRLDESNDGDQFELKVGERMEISLVSNPTTGFRWELVPGAEQIVVQIGETEFEADSEALGAGGRETFYFEALDKGEAELKLVYRRSWEDADPEQTFTLHISVN